MSDLTNERLAVIWERINAAISDGPNTQASLAVPAILAEVDRLRAALEAPNV